MKLGDEVGFSATLVKVSDNEGVHYTPGPLPNQKMTLRDRETGQLSQGIREYDEGIVVGKRTLTEYKKGEGKVAGTGFVAYLVAYRLDRKPVLVSEEDIWMR